MNNLTNNLAIVSNNSLTATMSPQLHHRDICKVLQKTLEFHEIIQIFSANIQELVPHSGFIYTNTEFKLNIRDGDPRGDSCSYKLTSENMALGELKLIRKDHFSKIEIYLLETLLGYLVTPLKNAALFNQALTMAYTDLLTKTNNRPAFNEAIKREITLARRYSTSLSLIFIDIDHFKMINDTYGQLCGDRALRTVADCIKNSIHACDTIYRYGGEEFSIILGDTNIKKATLLCEKIRQNIECISLNYNNQPLKLTASFGASSLHDDDGVLSFLNRTEGAMYKAKIYGRNQVVTR